MTVDQSTTSDEQLAQQIQQREQSSSAMQRATNGFEALYQRHSRLLLAFLASRVSKSDLEDVHQSVWQKIWQYLPKQFKGGNFRAWMYQIARNHLIDLSRKRKPEELAETADPVDESASPDASLVDEERQQILESCLQKLQDDMAQIVRRRLSGEDYNAICSQMDIKAARAHKLFFQAREQLTGCVQKEMT